MIPRECKRLAEVDFPIAEVSKHAAREKSIRHGHPSTLHLWWARRPLASSRAVLLALLLPDPCDAHYPEDFKQQARKILRKVRQPPTSDVELRQGLLSFIANFANWKNAADRTHLDVSRALVKAAHGEEPPLVVDPFAGGGSIPLEALRLGCEAFASDLIRTAIASTTKRHCARSSATDGLRSTRLQKSSQRSASSSRSSSNAAQLCRQRSSRRTVPQSKILRVSP